MSTSASGNSGESSKVWFIRFLLLIAGLGGLLFGIDVGIINGVLDYLKDTSPFLDAQKLSFVVAAVLLGSVISCLFAGLLADLIGRKRLMVLSGLLFVISIPMIAMSHDYWALMAGRILQGISGGLIGVVVPLYLAESLSSSTRGKGTGIFQWLLTLGFVVAALIARYFSGWLEGIEQLGDYEKLLAAKNIAWRGTFWVSMVPGILFTLGSLFVPESSRWLFRRGRIDAARASLLRTRTSAEAETELREMQETADAESSRRGGSQVKESLLHRKYVIPFLLACIILACNQATGINSVIGYNTTIYIQTGLNDVQAHNANFVFSLTNFLATIIGVLLVDRKGRKFLLSVGTAGIIASMVATGFMFQQTERDRVDCKDALQKMATDFQTITLELARKPGNDGPPQSVSFSLDGDIVRTVTVEGNKAHIELSRPLKGARKAAGNKAGKARVELEFAAGAKLPEQTVNIPIDDKLLESASAEGNALTLVLSGPIVDKSADGKPFAFVSDVDTHLVLPFTPQSADKLLEQSGEAGKALIGKPVTMVVIYAYGDYRSATPAQRADDKIVPEFNINRASCLPSSAVEGFITRNPFGNLEASKKAPLVIENALITPVPSQASGWLTAIFVFCYMAVYAIGPGVCVWLALSELMPTRIRSNGMSIALLLNTAVSTTIAAIFLPTVGRYGYANMFFAFAAFTVIYFITATFFLPETKGKTLEEIEEHFSGHAKGKS
jgi:sugar porter (SP) family MFS transporter